jgi:hypothetical protein
MLIIRGYMVAQLLEGPCYKPEGREFDSLCSHRHVLKLPHQSSFNMALDSTQPLIKIGTRNLLGGKAQPVCKAENLTAICETTA